MSEPYAKQQLIAADLAEARTRDEEAEACARIVEQWGLLISVDAEGRFAERLAEAIRARIAARAKA